MNKIYTKNDGDILDLGSALTMEGLIEDSIPDFLNWIKEHTPLIREDVYITKGIVMNTAFNLTGNNKYPDDCTIVSVKLDDMENSAKIILPRFEIGARWMDDIIENNLRKESKKRRC